MKTIPLSKGAAFAISRLEQHGFECYAVGGCVRDSLLGATPHDWDLTTNATPDEVAACFADCRVIETGKRHGTMTVLYESEPLEITTYRTDGIYEDNRHPKQVTFTRTLSDDLSRRDFTVNAMAYHPARGLVDLFGGQKDLADGVISCVGDPATRFHEDGLRILRALRFASKLGFSLDPATAAAVRDCRGLLDHIARERVREEFVKLLCGRGAAEILLAYPDVIGTFLPEMLPSVGFAQNTKYHCFDVYEHTVRALSFASPDPVLRLALFFHDLGKPSVRTTDADGDHFLGHAAVSASLCAAALERLRFDKATQAEVVLLVERHDYPIACTEKAVRRLLTKMSPETLRRLLELKKCDRLAHAPDFRTLSDEQTKIPAILDEILSRGDCLTLKTLAVDGDDLIALGYHPGKELGVALQFLLDAVIDGVLPNEKEPLLQAALKRLN